MDKIQGAKKAGTIRVLQFTDTHLFAESGKRLVGVDTYLSLQLTVQAALNEVTDPDFVLLTGDLSQDESKKSYQRLQEILGAINLPVFYLPGNHDQYDLMRETFSGCKPVFPADRSFIRGLWQIVMLDSTSPGRVEGIMSAAELARLDQLLGKNSDKNALICLHHSPVKIGAVWMDEIGLINQAEFLQIIDRYERVKGILWGHIHQQFDSERNGVRLMASPSTCVQFKELSDEFGVDNKPPGYRFLDLMPDGSINTAVSRLKFLPPGLIVDSKGY